MSEKRETNNTILLTVFQMSTYGIPGTNPRTKRPAMTATATHRPAIRQHDVQVGIRSPRSGRMCGRTPFLPGCLGQPKTNETRRTGENATSSNARLLFLYLFLANSYLFSIYPSSHPSIHPSIDRSIDLSIYNL